MKVVKKFYAFDAPQFQQSFGTIKNVVESL